MSNDSDGRAEAGRQSRGRRADVPVGASGDAGDDARSTGSAFRRHSHGDGRGPRFPRSADSAARKGAGKVSSGRHAPVSPRDSGRHSVSDDAARGSRRWDTSAVAGAIASFFGGRPRRFYLCLLAVVAVVVAGIVIGVGAYQSASVQGPITVEIAEGSSARSIARTLSSEHVIDSTGSFMDYVRGQDDVNALKPGTYTFTAHMSNEDVVAMLVAGPGMVGDRLTIPEGLDVQETAARVHDAIPSISEDSYLQLAEHGAPSYASDYPFLEGAYDDSLEGYLFPKTYQVSSDMTADDIIRMQLDQFETETASIDYSYASDKGLSRHDVITLASIIEEEAYIDSDRPKIASVIYNRLDQGMRLQLDSTVIYALQGTAGEHLSTEDTQVDSPYNTYVNDGLPPGPISNPGIASIEAAAQPDQTDYLYYVLTSKDGSQTFASNYDDFLAAKEVYKQVFGVQ